MVYLTSTQPVTSEVGPAATEEHLDANTKKLESIECVRMQLVNAMWHLRLLSVTYVFPFNNIVALNPSVHLYRYLLQH